ncbi:MAG: DUF4230 domain-containing protein [Bacteroidota bacterium]
MNVPNNNSDWAPKKIIAIGAVVITLLIAAPISMHYMVKAPVDGALLLAEKTAAGFKEMFNFTPKVTLNETVVIEENLPISELATVKRDLWVEHSWQHTFLGSTKKITVRGVYASKAGFDLNEKFTVKINRDNMNVVTDMPEPKILSLELKQYDLVTDKNGTWNKLTAQDRENAVRALQRIARDKAETSGIKQEAKSSVENRIREIAQRNGARAEFL